MIRLDDLNDDEITKCKAICKQLKGISLHKANFMLECVIETLKYQNKITINKNMEILKPKDWYLDTSINRLIAEGRLPPKRTLKQS